MMISLLQKFKPFLLFLIPIFVLNFGYSCQFSLRYLQCVERYHEDSNHETLVENLVNSLYSKSSDNLFYNESLNGIHGLFLCRGDVNEGTCQTCVNNATQFLPQNCSSYLGAVIWYDECLLRYSDTNFFGEISFSPNYCICNAQNVNSTGENSEVLSLLDDSIKQAQNSKMLFDAQQKVLSSNGSQSGYILTQCSRDLNSSSCYSCLKNITNQIRECCPWPAGWRFLAPSCFARYEEYPFFEMPRQGAGNGRKSIKKVVIISVSSSAAVFVFILAGFLCFTSYRKKRLTGGGNNEDIPLRNFQGPNQDHIVEAAGINEADEEHSGEMHYFSLAEIQAATNYFSDANKLGEGGFGPVYKGIMHNGREVAVKRLSMTSNQGVQEFENEVKLIIKLQHKNLVRLLGYCLEKDEKLLVYEYMANTSLDAFLFDATKCKLLDWKTRANIINGTAKGMQYLHEDSRLKIIHRDLKASNILLDDEMNPKISDFGTARIFGIRQMEANTERVVGTCGYMAPEYALEGQISVKSDVYSFGILMLEIISGKKNKGFSTSDCGQSLLAYAWMLWSEGKAVELIDPNIDNNCPENDVQRWTQIALLCVQDDPAHRPTMSSVVIMLGSKSTYLPQPSAARFLALPVYSSSSGNTGSLMSGQSTTNSTT
ncbi:hypothetical protein SLEP1_g54487 [Rubroshorea leprosula]|uniref:non-specific serine/threonine protein kinase n=1 Tax=Rubroshorea leprosula TaxID=152421 RepID=A0AAV5MD13_9ROSI|nr:hypothetical protein SLEP1_g54487 [Rubroshorea leprosula]